MNTLSIYEHYAVIISFNGIIISIMGILSNLYYAATICINHSHPPIYSHHANDAKVVAIQFSKINKRKK